MSGATERARAATTRLGFSPTRRERYRRYGEKDAERLQQVSCSRVRAGALRDRVAGEPWLQRKGGSGSTSRPLRARQRELWSKAGDGVALIAATMKGGRPATNTR